METLQTKIKENFRRFHVQNDLKNIWNAKKKQTKNEICFKDFLLFICVIFYSYNHTLKQQLHLVKFCIS
jgi:hypothetical protein